MSLGTRVAAAALLLAANVAVSAAPPSPAARATSPPPPDTGDGWATAAPDAAGLDGARLAAATERIRKREFGNVHAVLIESGGRLVYEEYFAGSDERWGDPLGRVTFDRTTLHDVRSITKSVTSALAGIAFGERAHAMLDRPLFSYFPEERSFATGGREGILLRHALTMTTGLEWNEELPYTDPRNDEIVLSHSANPTRYALSRPVVAAPGARFEYSGGAVHLVAAVVEREVRRPLRDHARDTLFAPLGIADWEWLGDVGGLPSAASGLRLRPRDLAKFGSLYLHEGKWNGKSVIPAGWVAESLRRSVTLRDGLPDMQAYGYFWWLSDAEQEGGALQVQAGIGNGGQRVYLLPELQMAVTILCGRYDDRGARADVRRLFVEHLLPARSKPGPAGR